MSSISMQHHEEVINFDSSELNLLSIVAAVGRLPEDEEAVPLLTVLSGGELADWGLNRVLIKARRWKGS